MADEEDEDMRSFIEESLAGLKTKLETLRLDVETRQARQLTVARQEGSRWEQQITADWERHKSQMDQEFQRFLGRHRFHEADEKALTLASDAQLQNIQAKLKDIDNKGLALSTRVELRRDCRSLLDASSKEVSAATSVEQADVSSPPAAAATNTPLVVTFEASGEISGSKLKLRVNFTAKDQDGPVGAEHIIACQDTPRKSVVQIQQNLQPLLKVKAALEGIPVPKEWYSDMENFVTGKSASAPRPIPNIARMEDALCSNHLSVISEADYELAKTELGAEGPICYKTKMIDKIQYLVDAATGEKQFVLVCIDFVGTCRFGMEQIQIFDSQGKVTTSIIDNKFCWLRLSVPVKELLSIVKRSSIKYVRNTTSKNGEWWQVPLGALWTELIPNAKTYLQGLVIAIE